MHVVLVARSRDQLQAVADEASRNAVRADVLVADLSEPLGVALVREYVEREGFRVDLLVNNAGFATHGAFEHGSAEREHAEVMVNVAAVVGLTHAFLPAMVSRREGAVINVASVAAFQPPPYAAVYGATKAFVLSFSEALSAENRDRGVQVLAVCPGATATAFFEVAGSGGRRGRSPEQVVATALRALDEGRSTVVDGMWNQLLVLAPRFVPRRLAARLVEWRLRPRTR
jgi:short-subunit dehydrogenase